MAWRLRKTDVFEKSTFLKKVSALFFYDFESAVLEECSMRFASFDKNKSPL